MKVTVDTNVLVRAVMLDDTVQARAAAKLLREANSIAIALPNLCEFVWVLLRVYKLQSADVAQALRVLIAASNVVVNRPAVEAGLAMLTVFSRSSRGRSMRPSFTVPPAGGVGAISLTMPR